ncbi:hypothetical protein [Aliikangiella sp. G2MR2-5]|uniref:hypothetical protein n=1 Tax=Aliikangiella sp. G2MR2-5 TaxID=2788943 RepID=UPI0018ABA23B|nr:hypothetical protein [Aliikangiella sp. G2MR2-5]
MKKSLLTIVAFLMSGNALALDCTANVLAVRVTKQGMLELKMDGPVESNYANICNVSQTSSSGITVETCKSWMSLALVAHSNNKKLKFWDVSNTSCATGSTLNFDRVSLAEN